MPRGYKLNLPDKILPILNFNFVSKGKKLRLAVIPMRNLDEVIDRKIVTLMYSLTAFTNKIISFDRFLYECNFGLRWVDLKWNKLNSLHRMFFSNEYFFFICDDFLCSSLTNSPHIWGIFFSDMILVVYFS